MEFERIRDIATELAIGAELTCAYLSGSYALGWQHAASDVDLFFVSPKDPPEATGLNVDVTVAPPAPSIGITFHDEIRFDVEYWREAHVDELVARFATPQGRETLSHADLDFLWRLQCGRPVLGDQVWFEARQSQVTPAALRQELARRAVYSAEVRLDDAAGLLAVGEPVMAAIASREAFGRVVDAVLNNAGSVAPPSKWRPRRLREAEGFTDFYREYVAVETMAGLDADEPAAWVRRVIVRARELIRDIET